MGNRGLGLITKQKIWSEYRYVFVLWVLLCLLKMSVCQNCVGVVGALIRLIFRLCKRKWDGLSQWPQRLSLRANEVTQHATYSSLTVHMCLNVPAALWNTFLQLHFGFSASYTHCENTHFTHFNCVSSCSGSVWQLCEDIHIHLKQCHPRIHESYINTPHCILKETHKFLLSTGWVWLIRCVS